MLSAVTSNNPFSLLIELSASPVASLDQVSKDCLIDCKSVAKLSNSSLNPLTIFVAPFGPRDLNSFFHFSSVVPLK